MVNSTYAILIKDLRVFGYIGLYSEEKLIGNEFIINVKIELLKNNIDIKNIQDTVNYQEVFNIIQHLLAKPFDLIEGFLNILLDKLKSKFPDIKLVKAEMCKITVPIPNFSGVVGVELIKEW